MFRLAQRDTRAPRVLRRSPSSLRLANTGLGATPANTLQSSLVHDQLFARARDALVLADLRSSRIFAWNPAAEELFGYSAAEAIGQSFEVLLAPEVVRLYREQVAHYVRTGDAEILTGRGPLRVSALTNGGAEIRVELSSAPLEAPRGSGCVLLTFRRVEEAP